MDLPILSIVLDSIWGAVPVGLTLVLWRRDRAASALSAAKDRRSFAARLVLQRVESLSARNLSEQEDMRAWLTKHFLSGKLTVMQEFGHGSWPLSVIMDEAIESIAEDQADPWAESTSTLEQAIERSIADTAFSLTFAFDSWENSAEYRASAFEKFVLEQQHSEFGGSEKLPAEEFDRLVKELLLLERSWWPWLEGSRLAPNLLLIELRGRRGVRWMRRIRNQLRRMRASFAPTKFQNSSR